MFVVIFCLRKLLIIKKEIDNTFNRKMVSVHTEKNKIKGVRSEKHSTIYNSEVMSFISF